MEHVILADGNEMTVEIPKEEYRTLVEDSINFCTLVHCLLRTAKLNWDKTGFTFNDTAINAVMASMVPEEYETMLADLQKEQEAEKEEEQS